MQLLLAPPHGFWVARPPLVDGDRATGSDIQVMLAGHGDFVTRWITITFAGDGRETASYGVPSLSSCQSLRLWSLTAPRLRREYQVATRVELQRQQTVVEKGIERCRHAHGVPEAHDGPCMRLEFGGPPCHQIALGRIGATGREARELRHGRGDHVGGQSDVL